MNWQDSAPAVELHAPRRRRIRTCLPIAAALIMAAGMWTFFDHVLIPLQEAEAAAKKFAAGKRIRSVSAMAWRPGIASSSARPLQRGSQCGYPKRVLGTFHRSAQSQRPSGSAICVSTVCCLFASTNCEPAVRLCSDFVYRDCGRSLSHIRVVLVACG